LVSCSSDFLVFPPPSFNYHLLEIDDDDDDSEINHQDCAPERTTTVDPPRRSRTTSTSSSSRRRRQRVAKKRKRRRYNSPPSSSSLGSSSTISPNDDEVSQRIDNDQLLFDLTQHEPAPPEQPFHFEEKEDDEHLPILQSQRSPCGELRVLSWNVNGAIASHHMRAQFMVDLSNLIISTSVDVLLLQDVRVHDNQTDYLSHLENSLSFTTERPISIANYFGFNQIMGNTATTGGLMTILCGRAVSLPRCRHDIRDKTNCGFIMGTVLYNDPVPLLIFNIYMPHDKNRPTSLNSSSWDAGYQSRLLSKCPKTMGLRKWSWTCLADIIDHECKEIKRDTFFSPFVIVGGDSNIPVDLDYSVNQTAKRFCISQITKLGLESQAAHHPTRSNSEHEIDRFFTSRMSPLFKIISCDVMVKGHEVCSDHHPVILSVTGSFSLLKLQRKNVKFFKNSFPDLKNESLMTAFRSEVDRVVLPTLRSMIEENASLNSIVGETQKSLAKLGRKYTKISNPSRRRKRFSTVLGTVLKSLHSILFDIEVTGVITQKTENKISYHLVFMEDLSEQIRLELEMVVGVANVNQVESLLLRQDAAGLHEFSMQHRTNIRQQMFKSATAKRYSRISAKTKAIERSFREGNLKNAINFILKSRCSERILDSSYDSSDNSVQLGREEVAKRMCNIFSDLFSSNKRLNDDLDEVINRPCFQDWIPFYHPSIEELDGGELLDISLEEFQQYIKDKSPNKAPGKSGLSINVFKGVGDEFFELLFEVTKRIISSLPRVTSWREKLVILLPKENNKDVRKQRPISLLEVWRKLCCGIIIKKIHDKISHHISHLQFGFTKGRSTDQAASLLLGVIEEAILNKSPLFMISIDIKKAFDSVLWDWIRTAALSFGVPIDIVDWILNFEQRGKSFISLEQLKATSSFFTPKTGTPQGSVEGPYFWNWIFNPLLKRMDEFVQNNGTSFPMVNGIHVGAIAFADDLIMFSTSIRNLGTLSEILRSFCSLTGLELSIQKCIITANNYGIQQLKSTLRGFNPYIQGDILEMFKQMALKTPGQSFRYLGHNIQLDGNIELELSRWRDVTKNISKIVSKKSVSPAMTSTVIRLTLASSICYTAKMQAHKSKVKEEKIFDEIDSLVIRSIKKAGRMIRSFSNKASLSPGGSSLIGMLSIKDLIISSRISHYLTGLRSGSWHQSLLAERPDDSIWVNRIKQHLNDLNVQIERIEPYHYEVGGTNAPSPIGVKLHSTPTLVMVLAERTKDFSSATICVDAGFTPNPLESKKSTSYGGIVILPTDSNSPDNDIWGGRVNLRNLGITEANRAETAMMLLAVRIASCCPDTQLTILSDCESVVGSATNLEDTNDLQIRCKIKSYDLWGEICDLLTQPQLNPVIKHIKGHPDKSFGSPDDMTYWEKYDQLLSDQKLIVMADYLASHHNPNGSNYEYGIAMIFVVSKFRNPQGYVLVNSSSSTILSQKLKKDLLGLMAQDRWDVYLRERYRGPDNRHLRWDQVRWDVVTPILEKRSKGYGRLDLLKPVIRLLDWAPTLQNMKRKGYKSDLYKSEDDPNGTTCKGCRDEYETMSHLVTDCPAYEPTRKKMWMELKNPLSKLGIDVAVVRAEILNHQEEDTLDYWSQVGLLTTKLYKKLCNLVKFSSNPKRAITLIIEAGLNNLERIWSQRTISNSLFIGGA